ncbi:MAG: carbon storage regulator [Planctomycetota bacterium]
MLVLTRKTQETIQVGDSVTIHVTRIKGNKVQLGIEAPTDVRILRGELDKLGIELSNWKMNDQASESTATSGKPDSKHLITAI